ncbi:hypothetical protein BTM502_02290 [Helicobacter pylori]
MQTHTHENFSQVKETKEIFEDSQVGNNPKIILNHSFLSFCGEFVDRFGVHVVLMGF